MPVRQGRHAELFGDLRRQARADRAVRVAHRIGQLHLLAPFEHGARILHHLRVQAVGHFVAPGIQREAALFVGRVDLGQDRVEVEVVQMLGAAIDLLQQLGAADHFVQAAEAQARQYLAHFLGDEGHEVDDLFRRAGEFLAQLLVLHAHAHRAGVAVALAHHDAAHRHQAQRADAEFLRAQDRGDHDVAPGLEPAIGAQLDAMAQAIERQHLIGFRKTHFPGRAGIFDRRLRARPGAARMAGHHNDVSLGLGHPGGNGSHTHCGHELDVYTGVDIGVFEVMDELRQILD